MVGHAQRSSPAQAHPFHSYNRPMPRSSTGTSTAPPQPPAAPPPAIPGTAAHPQSPATADWAISSTMSSSKAAILSRPAHSRSPGISLSTAALASIPTPQLLSPAPASSPEPAASSQPALAPSESPTPATP